MQIYKIFPLCLMFLIWGCGTEDSYSEKTEEIEKVEDRNPEQEKAEPKKVQLTETKPAPQVPKEPSPEAKVVPTHTTPPKKAISKTQAIEPEFTEELLKAVNNWKKIPPSVFPLQNVSIQESVTFQLIGKQNEIMASSPVPAGKEVVAKAIRGNTLLISPSVSSNLKATIDMEKTDFKQCVAFRFEMGKKIIEMREKRRKEMALGKREGITAASSSKDKQESDNMDELTIPGDFGHGKFCICSDCRQKRLALTGSMK